MTGGDCGSHFDTPLPIDDALPRLTAALRRSNAAVLVAPPGAGKTTRVPLVLLDEPWAQDKKILVLEPRRLAARAAAARMAATLGEQVGETVGLRVRFGSKVSQAHAHRGGHRRRVHAARSSTIRRSTASPPCCSTNSTSARSMPTSAWRWRATRSRACARI